MPVDASTPRTKAKFVRDQEPEIISAPEPNLRSFVVKASTGGGSGARTRDYDQEINNNEIDRMQDVDRHMKKRPHSSVQAKNIQPTRENVRYSFVNI